MRLIKNSACGYRLRPKNSLNHQPGQVECLAALTRRPGRRESSGSMPLVSPLAAVQSLLHPHPHPHHHSAPLNYWSPDLLRGQLRLFFPLGLGKDELLVFLFLFIFVLMKSIRLGGGCSFAFLGDWGRLLVVDRQPKG